MYSVYINGTICDPNTQCMPLLDSLVFELRQLPNARLRIVRQSPISIGDRIRIAQDNAVIFEGFITSVNTIPGAGSVYEVEAANDLFLRGDRRVYFLGRRDTLRDLIEEVVSVLNLNIQPQIAHVERGFESEVIVDGEFEERAIDILNLVFEQTGIRYQLAQLNNQLALVGTKTRDMVIGGTAHRADKLALPVYGWANYYSQSKAMLIQHGAYLRGLSRTLFVRSKIHDYKISAEPHEPGSEACYEPDYPKPERDEPCIILDSVAVDINSPLTFNLKVPPQNQILGQSIPITNLAMRGYIIKGQHSEGYDNRFDITLDLDYWRRNKGKLRVYVREDLAGDWLHDPYNPQLPPTWSPNIIELMGRMWKEVIILQQNGMEPVYVTDYKPLDDPFWQSLAHGQVLEPGQVSDPYLQGLLAGSEARQEARVMLLRLNLASEYRLINPNGSIEVSGLAGWIVGLTHVQGESLTKPAHQLTNSLGILKRLEFRDGHGMAYFEPPSRFGLEEVVIQSRRLYQQKAI